MFLQIVNDLLLIGSLFALFSCSVRIFRERQRKDVISCLIFLCMLGEFAINAVLISNVTRFTPTFGITLSFLMGIIVAVFGVGWFIWEVKNTLTQQSK